MWECPDFLDLPARARKPRERGLTHVLDKGTPLPVLAAALEGAGELIDVAKVGWGIAYVDPLIKSRAGLYTPADVLVSLGGTLLELAAAQGRVDALRGWAAEQGVGAIEVSNGLGLLDPAGKTALVRALAGDRVVFAETGAKDDRVPVVPAQWVAEMAADLDAGASWVIAEGRESGTVGLYGGDGAVREDLVELIAERLPLERVIFEAPRKAQQAWFVRRFGPDVNLGNVAIDEVLPLETLRLGLRADTALGMPGAPGRREGTR
jgi:phosphosulfolactate synthase